MEALMKPLMQFGLCCLLAPGLFAEYHGGGAVSGGHAGSVTSGHNAGHAHGSIRTFGYGCYGAIFRTAKGKNAKRLWILDADLTTAFDKIDHVGLLRALGTFPGRKMIAAWLKAG